MDQEHRCSLIVGNILIAIVGLIRFLASQHSQPGISPGDLEEFSFSAQLDNWGPIPDWLVYNYVWRCYPEGKTMGLRF